MRLASQLNPECGYLGGYGYTSENPSLFLQYWRSYDDLLAYARCARVRSRREMVQYHHYYTANPICDCAF